MPVIVAEYLGIRTDRNIKIEPIHIIKNKMDDSKHTVECPFRNALCDKITRGNKPICSLRDVGSGALWIVCPHRFCASSPKNAPLNEYQASILHSIAKAIYGSDIKADEVLVKREVPIVVTDESTYSADYVMWCKNPSQNHPLKLSLPVVLEMQGGGETTNTGALTTYIDNWENNINRNNTQLLQPVKKVSPLVTNAWRRQQEQFLVKGNVATQTGGRMVFCVGSMIFDYLMKRFTKITLPNLRKANWTLAFIGIIEDAEEINAFASARHSIPLKIDTNRMLFTNYQSFVQVLTNQAEPSPSLFAGTYIDLLGNEFVFQVP